MSTTELISLFVSSVAGIAWIVTQFNTIANLKKDNDSLEERVLSLEQKRNEDVLGFTKTLAEFNLTLTRFDSTLNGVNNTLREVKEAIRNHEKDIRDLLTKGKNDTSSNNRNNS